MRNFANRLFISATIFVFTALPFFAEAKVDEATTAVVIVDMQQGFYDRGGVSNSIGLLNLVNRQIELLEWAVYAKVPVLFFEYNGFGPTDPRLTDVLAGHLFQSVIKFDDNGFRDPSREPAVKFLESANIKSLIVSGINGNACVQGTVMGAISSGFDVVTSSDIVGNLNYNPPIYPNATWYFNNQKLEVRQSLEEVIY